MPHLNFIERGTFAATPVRLLKPFSCCLRGHPPGRKVTLSSMSQQQTESTNIIPVEGGAVGKRILVTGANAGIGFWTSLHVCDQLSVDRFSQEYEPSRRLISGQKSGKK